MMFQDFLLDDNGDLLIENGDFVIGASDQQHVEDIIQSFPGEWKQYPFVGVGIIQFLNSENGQEAINLIKQQLQADGYMVNAINVSKIDGELQVSFPNNGIQRI